jgi:hypothetical protein
MIGSEMFLDSAQNLDSVISHAKELNYLPRSYASSQTTLDFNISTVGTNQPFSIPKGTKFTGTNSNGNFTFVTYSDHNFTYAGNTVAVANLPVIEGKYISDSYIVDYSNTSQNFVLSNPKINTDTLTVTVTESNTITTFSLARTLYNITSSSNVFFLQAAQNNRYEIVFGDGNLGRKPQNLALVTANYIVASGSDASSCNNFVCEQDLGTINNGKATLSQITIPTVSSTAPTVSSTAGNSESIESIRFNAPRYFATQQRAISTDDYSSLIFSNFAGTISDINVYGGETLTPPQYGAVALCIKPNKSTNISDNLKNEVLTFIDPYISIPNRVIITDPDYLYCSINTTVQYDSTKTSITTDDLKSLILNRIKQFSVDNVEKFNNDFRYSKFVSYIDNTENSITSNDTAVKIIKRITPSLNSASSYILEFNNAANLESYNPSIGYYPYAQFGDEPVVTSSSFTYVDGAGVSYPSSYIRDDNTGNLVVYYDDSNGNFQVITTIGKIDYTTGYVTINGLTVSSYTDYISIYMVPKNKDILVNKNKILIIETSDVTVNLIKTLV